MPGQDQGDPHDVATDHRPVTHRSAGQAALGLIWLLDAAGYGPEPSRDRVHESVIS